MKKRLFITILVLSIGCGGGGKRTSKDFGQGDEGGEDLSVEDAYDAKQSEGEELIKPDGQEIEKEAVVAEEEIAKEVAQEGIPEKVEIPEAQGEKLQEEVIEEVESPECPCIENQGAPFCGIDGKTYWGDQCAKCAICKNCNGCTGFILCEKESDYLKMYGDSPWKGKCEDCLCDVEIECKIIEKEAVKCPPVPGEVCDTSGETLPDLCALKKKYKCYDGYIENLQNWGACPMKPECPDKCPPELWPPNPVCGVDGETYQHACSAKACPKNSDKVGVAYCGPCNFCNDPLCAGKPKGCVCGVDGKSYANECEAHQCGKTEVAYPAACCPECKEQPKDEVCGKDYKLYYNKCALSCVGVDPCPLGDPVCGKDSNTYFGECEAICRSGGVLYPGPCKGPCDNCEKVFAPVCGEDGKTYASQCFLTCKQGKVFKEGVCDDCANICGTPQNPKNPPNPVCGTDGVTYPDSCFAQKCVGVSFIQGACSK